ncbi:predicted protein [Streptomyces sp. C]|nr:predicted protein [Streptomyces sp. C]
MTSPGRSVPYTKNGSTPGPVPAPDPGRSTDATGPSLDYYWTVRARAQRPLFAAHHHRTHRCYTISRPL